MIELELDTGVSSTVINSNAFCSIKNGLEEVEMIHCSVKLKTYSRVTNKGLGKALISVRYKSQIFILKLYIIEMEKTTFFGRDWLLHF